MHTHDENEKEALQDLLVRQAMGEALAPLERERLEQAQARDPGLAADAASLKRTVDQLALATEAEPPARLRARVLESVRRQTRPRVTSIARPRWQWSYAMAASVALLAVIAGAALLVENQRLKREIELEKIAATTLREPNVVMSFALEGTGGGAKASGRVLLDLDAKRASIAVRDLPKLPAGQSYYLWALLDSKKVPCGEFKADADGRIVTQFPIPVDSYTSPVEQLVMTIETGSGLTAPLGPVVMASS
jgi:Anti-sigma-K factor rskA